LFFLKIIIVTSIIVVSRLISEVFPNNNTAKKIKSVDFMTVLEMANVVKIKVCTDPGKSGKSWN